MEPQSAALSEPMLPPAECLEQLATARRKPEATLRAGVNHIAEMAPTVLAVLERVAAGVTPSEEEGNLLFYGLHVLGAGREQSAFQPLMRFLRSDPVVLHDLLGDAKTESMPRIVASLFDGDADALFALIVDRKVDEFMRYELMLTAAFLTWDGKIEGARMIGFLERFDDERLTPDYDATWDAFPEAIGLLGLSALAPRVERAWREDRISEMITDRSYFTEDLARAEAAPEDGARFAEMHQGYIEDVVQALHWLRDENEEEEDESFEDDDMLEALVDDEAKDEEPRSRSAVETPATNPMRHVGRNDPCPCGSGKKAKRCCLAR